LAEVIGFKKYQTGLTEEMKTTQYFEDLKITREIKKVYNDPKTISFGCSICKTIIECKTWGAIGEIMKTLDKSQAYRNMQYKDSAHYNLEDIDNNDGKSIFKILEILLRIERSSDEMKLDITKYVNFSYKNPFLYEKFL